MFILTGPKPLSFDFTEVPEVLLGVKALRTRPSLLSAKDKMFF